MVVARPAVTVVARAKDSAAMTEGYRGDGGGGDEDDSKTPFAAATAEAAPLISVLFSFFLVGLTTKSRVLFFCSIHSCHVMTQTTVRQLHMNWRTLSDSSKGTKMIFSIPK